MSINNNNKVVGWCETLLENKVHGFIYDMNNETYTAVYGPGFEPGEVPVLLTGINDMDIVVGFYLVGQDEEWPPDMRGFVYDGDTYSTVDPQDWQDTYGIESAGTVYSDISNSGKISGFNLKYIVNGPYGIPFGKYSTFLYDGTSMVNYDYPDGFSYTMDAASL